MTAVAIIAFSILMFSGALCLARVIRPGSLADRIVGLDSLLVVIVSGVAVGFFWDQDGVFLDILVVTALLHFVGTITVARYIEKRGA